MRKRLLAIIATAAMVVTMIPAMVFAYEADTVATVNNVEYSDLQEAIKAAAPSGTVEIVSDIEDDEWIMFSETLTLSGKIITLKIDGLTINGNGHKLTIKSVESGTNGGYLFYDATNLNINNLTINMPNGGGGIGMDSGVINKVAFAGGNGIYPGNGGVTVKECAFKTDGDALYYEQVRENIVVTNCTFDIADNANIIILRGKEKFTNNTINGGRTVNIANSSSAEVSGNTFNNDVRLKVYNDATANIENNKGVTNLEFSDLAGETKSTFKGNELGAKAEAALEAVGGENLPADPAPAPSTPVQKPDASPNTGDNSVLPFAVAGITLAAMAAVVVTRRREN